MKKIFVSLLACLIFTTSVMGSTGELTIDFTKDLKGERTYYYGPGAEFRLYLSESVVRAAEQYYAAYHIYPNDVAGKEDEYYLRLSLPSPYVLSTFEMNKVGTAAGASLVGEVLGSDRRTVLQRKNFKWDMGQYSSHAFDGMILPAGDYYFHFYDLRINDCISSCKFAFVMPVREQLEEDDTAGRNDTMTTATKLNKRASGYISSLGDDKADWFEIEANGNESILRTSHSSYLIVELYKYENGTLVPLDLGDKDKYGDYQVSLQKGKYYIVYKPGMGSPAAGYYDLSLSQKDSSSSETQPSETQPIAKVTSIKIQANPSTTICAGKKVTLTATVSPKNAVQGVTWKSSNKNYATVTSKGVVATKKAGIGKTVTITAKAKDGSGKTAKIKIKIVKDGVTKIKLKGKTSGSAGKQLTIKATVTAGKTANTELKWISSNKEYATVNKNGVVTLKEAGKGKYVRITAMATDGTGVKGSIKIKIT